MRLKQIKTKLDWITIHLKGELYYLLNALGVCILLQWLGKMADCMGVWVSMVWGQMMDVKRQEQSSAASYIFAGT